MFNTKKICLAIILLSSFFPIQEAQAQAQFMVAYDIAMGVLSSIIYDTGKEAYKAYDQCKIKKGEDKCSKNNIEDAKKYESIIEELKKNNRYSQETISTLNEEVRLLRERIEIQKNQSAKTIKKPKKDVNELKHKKSDSQSWLKNNSKPNYSSSPIFSLPSTAPQPSYNFSLPTTPKQQPSTFSLPSTVPQLSYNFSLPTIPKQQPSTFSLPSTVPQPSYNFSSQPSYHNEHTRHHSRSRRWYSSEFSPPSSYSQRYPDDSNRHHHRHRR